MRKRRMLPGGTGPNRKEIRGRLKFVHSRTMKLAHSCVFLSYFFLLLMSDSYLS